jgi:hypothetical protein
MPVAALVIWRGYRMHMAASRARSPVLYIMHLLALTFESYQA